MAQMSGHSRSARSGKSGAMSLSSNVAKRRLLGADRCAVFDAHQDHIHVARWAEGGYQAAGEPPCT
jgi:hypothetical protein